MSLHNFVVGAWEAQLALLAQHLPPGDTCSTCGTHSSMHAGSELVQKFKVRAPSHAPCV